MDQVPSIDGYVAACGTSQSGPEPTTHFKGSENRNARLSEA